MELLELLEKGWDGYHSTNERRRPGNYDRALKETIDLLTNRAGHSSRKRAALIEEAMTTSDFPYLLGDVLDRTMIAAYEAVNPVWKLFTKRGTVSRIYPQVGAYRFQMGDGDQYLDEVGQKGEYLASNRTETRYSIYVRKYGRQFDISWETLINDDLGALLDTPQRFARAAARTEHRLITGAYAADVGTHAALNLYENAVNMGTLALTIGNLETSVSNMRKFTDVNGEPIMSAPKYLVVPPDLEFTARAILTSATKMYTAESIDVDGTVYSTPYPTANVISQSGLVLVVDPYLPILDETYGTTAWYLFSDPADVAALEHDYLTGHERPEICMKASDKVAVGGGEMSPMSGDFATDNIFYRVRDVFGANKLDWRGTYANIPSYGQ